MSDIKYPKGEIAWTSYYKDSKMLFLLTSKTARDYYFLYEVSDEGKLKKLGKSKTPTELEKKFGVETKIS